MLLQSLLITGAIQAFFLILLLKSKEKNADPDRLLMLWLAIIGLQLIFYFDNLSARPLAPAPLQCLGFSLPLLGSGFLYLYIYALSFGTRFHWRKTGVHVLPYILFNAIVFGVNLLHHHTIIVSYGFPHFNQQLPDGFRYGLTFALAVVPGYYTILSLLVLLKYQKLLPQNYSSTEKITLNWLKWIVISLLVLFFSLFGLIRYGVNYGLLTYRNLFAVVGSILSGYIFFIGYFGLKQTTVFTNIPVTKDLVEPGNSPMNYKKSGLREETAERLFQQLKLHMEEKQAYLAEELNLSMLAIQLGLTPNQLSQVINQKSGVNFFDFVNSYRLQAVKEKLKDPAYQHYSILSIAYDCGFKSKSSFNKVFKQMEGKTPSQYQKS